MYLLYLCDHGKKYQDPEAEVRALREEFKLDKNAEKKQAFQCETAGEEGKSDEDGKMEVDEEVESKKKLDERKKKLQNSLRDIDKFADMEQRMVDEQKER